MNPLLLVDSYKVHHTRMYPEGMTLLYSNFTPRKSRIPGIDKVIVFGLQHFIKEYLLRKFNIYFFDRPLNEVINEYKFAINIDTQHIVDLHTLGYLPIEIKALPEGTKCPIGVPLLTIKNTHKDFGWLVNYLETLISCQLWQPITSATIANSYHELLTKYALETTGNSDGVQWQGHDFSMRGMSSVESAILSGMGHLTSFTGTDTIPAIYALKNSYNTKEGELIGASVPATEHSVMCMGQKESEIDTFRRLLNLYPTGILSVVSDTWNLWDVLTKHLPALKEEILARDGKLVIRPDSGDPVDIICGHELCGHPFSPEDKGVIELLWNLFGGTIVKGNDGNEYKVLDSHIGAIYGDSITLERAKQICERLKAKGFASINIVLGIGSYTYQYNTRDTFGFAMKATYGEVKPPCNCSEHESANLCQGDCIECREIFKDPITDDGTKKSKKGLLMVREINDYGQKNPEIKCFDQQSWLQESTGMLQTVFKNGKITKEYTLEEIRNKIKE
jgi:nicotinamide phosphoribosyltransferase